jgi:hypothetical protein
LFARVKKRGKGSEKNADMQEKSPKNGDFVL